MCEKRGYESINHLIRDLWLDTSHWINAEAMRFVSRAEYDKTRVSLRHVPEGLSEVSVTCSNGHTFNLDQLEWIKKRPPVSVFFKEGRGLLRQGSYCIPCRVPGCSAQAPYKIESPPYRGELEVYGDEAFRETATKSIFVYSFLSFSGSRSCGMRYEGEMDALKREIAPSIEPAGWALHMKELLSPEKRQKRAYLAHLNQKAAVGGAQKAATILGRYNTSSDLNIHVAVGIYDGVKLRDTQADECKAEVYSASLMRVVQQVTAVGLAPRFYFERTQRDGWAKRLFDGGRLTLVWAHITRGLPVMSPKFVEPTVSVHLQAADVASYTVASFLYNQARKSKDRRDLDIPLEALGKVRYTFTTGRDWECGETIGFPSSFLPREWRG